MHFSGGRHIRDLLETPKDRGTILQKSEMIYRYTCGRVECEEEYIGEPDRTFAERLKEHLKASSPIHHHDNTTGHAISIDNFKHSGEGGTEHCQINQRSHPHQRSMTHP